MPIADPRRNSPTSFLAFTASIAFLSLSATMGWAQVSPGTANVSGSATGTNPAIVQTAAPAGLNAFTREVLKNFDAWDTDHDGVLSEKEIDARLTDPNTTGNAAAAVGAIKLAMRSGKFELPPLTKEYFLGYAEYARLHPRARTTPAAGTTPAPGVTPANPETAIVPVSNTPPPTAKAGTAAPRSTAFPLYEASYAAAQRRIKSTPKDLFATPNPLTLDAIHQGQIGDCYLLSVLGGMIHRDPSSIAKLVKAEPDGSGDVTLPSGMTAHVGPITDAEVAVSSGTGGTGRWLPLLEEAYGRFRVRIKSHATEDTPDEIGTDSTTKGGSVRTTISQLTGHKVASISFRKRGESQQVPTVEQVTPKLPDVRKAVIAALKENRLVGAGTGAAGSLPPAINGRHAYAIIGFDEAADTLTIWNPHNNNFTPKGEPGLANGYPTKGGVFQMPLVDFARVYPGIEWETNTDLNAPATNGPAATPATAIAPSAPVPGAPAPATLLPASGKATPSLPAPSTSR